MGPLFLDTYLLHLHETELCFCVCTHTVAYLLVEEAHWYDVDYLLLLNSDLSAQLSPCIFHRLPATTYLLLA